MYIQLQNFGSKTSLKSMFREGVYECAERIHQFPEIVLVMDGEVIITVDGKEEIARSGDIAVITPFRTHSFRTSKYCKIWIGVISGDFTEEFFSGARVYQSGEKAVFTPTRSLFLYVLDHLPTGYDEPYAISDDITLYRKVKA